MSSKISKSKKSPVLSFAWCFFYFLLLMTSSERARVEDDNHFFGVFTFSPTLFFEIHGFIGFVGILVCWVNRCFNAFLPAEMLSLVLVIGDFEITLPIGILVSPFLSLNVLRTFSRSAMSSPFLSLNFRVLPLTLFFSNISEVIYPASESKEIDEYCDLEYFKTGSKHADFCNILSCLFR